MYIVYFQQAGKLNDGTCGRFWTLGGVAVPAAAWNALDNRVAGLQKNMRGRNYDPRRSRIDANDLLHPRNICSEWAQTFSRGIERIATSLGVKVFLLVIDKNAADRPATAQWLLPLSYHYILRPVRHFLAERQTFGTIIIPPGRPEELETLEQAQTHMLQGQQGRRCPIIGSPLTQPERHSTGLQLADFVATVGRRYHEDVFPRLFRKEILEGYDAEINRAYQGFVKPNTYTSDRVDERGYRMKGYVYLWHRGDRNTSTDALADPTREHVGRIGQMPGTPPPSTGSTPPPRDPNESR